MAGYQSRANEERQESVENENIDSAQHARASPAAELATSIFHFVQIADSLGMTLSTIAAEQESDDFTPQRGELEQITSDAGEDGAVHTDSSQIQLLRLRIKHREIIIFPDPRYLCCVVQRQGRQAGINTR